MKPRFFLQRELVRSNVHWAKKKKDELFWMFTARDQ